jgi:hypothetical protein
MSEHDQTLDDTAFDISDVDIEQFVEQGASEPPSYHTILQVWREVLKPAASEKDEKVLPEFAHKITSSYREVNYADMPAYVDRYFSKILELAGVVEAQIATDEDCLSHTEAAEDVEHNSHHYRRIITDWQLHILDWEIEWDCTDPLAGVELAAISEVQKLFLGAQGMAAYLDQIGFRFTEADKAALLEELEERKNQKDGQ